MPPGFERQDAAGSSSLNRSSPDYTPLQQAVTAADHDCSR